LFISRKLQTNEHFCFCLTVCDMLHLASYLRAPSLGVKQLGRDTKHSPPPSAEGKNVWTVPPLSHMSSWHNA